MAEAKNNIFVVNLNMEDRTLEEIAREATLKIIEITDDLVARQNAHKEGENRWDEKIM